MAQVETSAHQGESLGAFELPSLDVEGAAAPPRLNGELVFAAPWESRSFAMAFALVERGDFTWDEFRDHLIDCIARWEQQHAGSGAETAEPEAGSSGTDDFDAEYRYYECWQQALEEIVAARAILGADDLAERVQAFEARPPGHDHGDHDHDHDHHHGHDHHHHHG